MKWNKPGAAGLVGTILGAGEVAGTSKLSLPRCAAPHLIGVLTSSFEATLLTGVVWEFGVPGMPRAAFDGEPRFDGVPFEASFLWDLETPALGVPGFLEGVPTFLAVAVFFEGVPTFLAAPVFLEGVPVFLEEGPAALEGVPATEGVLVLRLGVPLVGVSGISSSINCPLLERLGVRGSPSGDLGLGEDISAP